MLNKFPSSQNKPVDCKSVFWMPCVIVLIDTKLSSDSADREECYARRESADESFSLELIADI